MLDQEKPYLDLLPFETSLAFRIELPNSCGVFTIDDDFEARKRLEVLDFAEWYPALVFFNGLGLACCFTLKVPYFKIKIVYQTYHDFGAYFDHKVPFLTMVNYWSSFRTL